MIEPEHPQLSIARQCQLVSISRSGFYHRPAGETPLNLELMRLIDAQFLETPWYGSRQMARHLRSAGYAVGHKRVLRDLPSDRPDQVWRADITYLPVRRGFLYLVAARCCPLAGVEHPGRGVLPRSLGGAHGAVRRA